MVCVIAALPYMVGVPLLSSAACSIAALQLGHTIARAIVVTAVMAASAFAHAAVVVKAPARARAARAFVLA